MKIAIKPNLNSRQLLTSFDPRSPYNWDFRTIPENALREVVLYEYHRSWDKFRRRATKTLEEKIGRRTIQSYAIKLMILLGLFILAGVETNFIFAGGWLWRLFNVRFNVESVRLAHCSFNFSRRVVSSNGDFLTVGFSRYQPLTANSQPMLNNPADARNYNPCDADGNGRLTAGSNIYIRVFFKSGGFKFAVERGQILF